MAHQQMAALVEAKERIGRITGVSTD